MSIDSVTLFDYNPSLWMRSLSLSKLYGGCRRLLCQWIVNWIRTILTRHDLSYQYTTIVNVKLVEWKCYYELFAAWQTFFLSVLSSREIRACIIDGGGGMQLCARRVEGLVISELFSLPPHTAGEIASDIHVSSDILIVNANIEVATR